MRVVLDTSVMVAAALSRRGASFAIVEMIPSRRFEVCLSISLYMEWVAVLTRAKNLPPGTSVQTTLGFLRRLASLARLQDIHYLWRPFLPDPDDDMVLELAFAGSCDFLSPITLMILGGPNNLASPQSLQEDSSKFFKTNHEHN